MLCIAATHACVTVAAAGAIAAVAAGDKTRKKDSKKNRRRFAARGASRSPAAAALVRFAVAVAATWSAIETIGVSIEASSRITVSGLTEAFLTTSTPVREHLSAT